MVRTGNVTSGNSETGSRLSDTEPRSTTASIAAIVETGFLTANAGSDKRLSGDGVPC